MTKSKSSVSSIIVPSIFMIHLNDTCVSGSTVTVISTLTKI